MKGFVGPRFGVFFPGWIYIFCHRANFYLDTFYLFLLGGGGVGSDFLPKSERYESVSRQKRLNGNIYRDCTGEITRREKTTSTPGVYTASRRRDSSDSPSTVVRPGEDLQFIYRQLILPDI